MTVDEFGILLIEDEPDAAARMGELLKRLDMRLLRTKESSIPTLTIASNQNEADAAIRNRPQGFDIIILDLRYPARDGRIGEEFEGMRWLPTLRQLQPHAVIAVQTAYPYGDQMENAVAALRDYQVDEFIPKTTNWKSTEARLAAAWNRTRERRWGQFVYDGYVAFQHSRVFRAIAEDAREVVYRRSSAFFSLARQLEADGHGEAATALTREYGDLIEEIVEVTSPLDAQDNLTPSEVNCANLLDGLQLVHSRVNGDRGITISIDSAQGRVHTLERDLRTALHELIENATESVGRGGHVFLSAKPVSSPRPGVEIIIWDDGPGFSDSILRDPFKRASSTREKMAKPFRGMGLYLSRRIVDKIFGTITLRNRALPEHGAEVCVFVPDLTESVEHV